MPKEDDVSLGQSCLDCVCGRLNMLTVRVVDS